ncbi:MAG: hypothetical protein Q7U91_15915 [Sideroxyarcus sp.]|nr:hypothetical protein [Sideroxyarcus sp.]
MAKFSHAMRTVLVASLIAGLSGCGEEEKKTPPPPPPAPLTVGGTVSGLAGGEVVLQLNSADELVVKADGKFKFPKPQAKGGAYAVTVKTQPNLPVKQTCAVNLGSGNIAAVAINNVDVACTTNTYAVGGTVSGLTAKSKGLVLELKGGNEAKIAKNGNFVFPDTRLPDGSDYSVAIKSTPAGQKCTIEAISDAPDTDTINVVAVTCAKKGRK